MGVANSYSKTEIENLVNHKWRRFRNEKAHQTNVTTSKEMVMKNFTYQETFFDVHQSVWINLVN